MYLLGHGRGRPTTGTRPMTTREYATCAVFGLLTAVAALAAVYPLAHDLTGRSAIYGGFALVVEFFVVWGLIWAFAVAAWAAKTRR